MKTTHVIFVGIGVFLLTLLALSLINSSKLDNSGIDAEKFADESGVEKVKDNPLWKNLTLKNLQNSQEYTISELYDKPILLESFAVWCPSCTRQQRQIEDLKSSDFGENFYSISLNTDQNENEEKVLEHIKNNGFSGIYSISNKEFTDSLIETFGLSIVNAPSMPIVLICQGSQETHFLKSGLKTSSELKESIESLC